MSAEGGLDAVAVMGVEIDIEDALEALLQEGQDREGGVVEVAEAAGMVAHAVVRAARGVVGDPALGREPGCQDGAADRGAGAPEQALEDRVFHRADAVALAHRGADAAAILGRLQGGDIVGRVELEQVVEGGDGAVDIGARALRLEPAELLAQRQHGADALDGERMIAAVAGFPVDLAGDETARHSGPSRHPAFSVSGPDGSPRQLPASGTRSRHPTIGTSRGP